MAQLNFDLKKRQVTFPYNSVYQCVWGSPQHIAQGHLTQHDSLPPRPGGRCPRPGVGKAPRPTLLGA